MTSPVPGYFSNPTGSEYASSDYSGELFTTAASTGDETEVPSTTMPLNDLAAASFPEYYASEAGAEQSVEETPATTATPPASPIPVPVYNQSILPNPYMVDSYVTDDVILLPAPEAVALPFELPPPVGHPAYFAQPYQHALLDMKATYQEQPDAFGLGQAAIAGFQPPVEQARNQTAAVDYSALIDENSEFLQKKDTRKLDDRVYDAFLAAFLENKSGVRERYGLECHPELPANGIGDLAGLIYMLHMVDDKKSAKPPFGGGNQWRVYSKKHYSTKARVTPITCKVHELKDQERIIRLYHYYRGIKSTKKRASHKRMRSECDAEMHISPVASPREYASPTGLHPVLASIVNTIKEEKTAV